MAATAAPIVAAAAANETVAAPLAALALAAELEADAERVDAPRTAEEETAGMEEVRAAAVEFGDNAKAHSWHGWAGTMARRFRRFLQRHGERLGYEEGAEADADGPGLEVVRQFIDWCWAGYARLNFSPVAQPRRARGGARTRVVECAKLFVASVVWLAGSGRQVCVVINGFVYSLSVCV